MQGTINLYKAQKGYGFILGEDEKEYFFHISQVKPSIHLILGMNVVFEPNKSEKGLFATKIVCPDMETDKFIKLGNVRIKACNIKDYGISSKTSYYQKVYKQEYMYKTKFIFFKSKTINLADTDSWYRIDKSRYEKLRNKEKIFLHILTAEKGEYLGKNRDEQGHLYYVYAPYDGIYDLNIHCSAADMSHSISTDDVKAETVEYLYITTFQGDHYQFCDESFDIHEKLKELDNELK